MNSNQKPRLHASWIDPFARDIVERLQRSGFKSYLVGGCVRDLLCGMHPKDYDIATDASPQDVKRKVYGSYIIGRRFRLVLVKRGDQQYEVATFRRESTLEDLAPNELQEEGAEAPKGDNFFGTPEQDALRRDFTVNAIFYDPLKDDLIDYAKGLEDIEGRTLRIIGDPNTRIQEDSIRSFRALRLSHKLSFKIEESLRDAIFKNAELLAQAAMPRRREEFLKMLRLKEPSRVFLEMYDLDILKHCLPSLHELFQSPEQREIFLSYLDRWTSYVQNPSDPVEMYSALAWAYSCSLGSMKNAEDQIAKLLKDEFGVFKMENLAVFSVFEMQSKLRDTEAFGKRGLRRQQGFLRHEGLPLALQLATADFALPAATISFWQKRLQQND